MSGNLADLKSKKLWIAILAEFVGTFILVLVACGSTMYNPSVLHISLCFGFSVASAVWAICHISGGHINPAVTFGFLVTRKITLIRALFYVIAQVFGAIIAAAVLKGLTNEDVYVGTFGTPTLQNGINSVQGFVIELLITFVFVFVVFSSVDSLRGDIGGSVPLTIGIAIAMCHLWAVSILTIYYTYHCKIDF